MIPKRYLIPLLVFSLLASNIFGHTSSPDHSHLLNTDFSGSMSFEIEGKTDSILTIHYKRQNALLDSGIVGGIKGWDYLVIISVPAKLSDKEKAISLYSLGLQGYRHQIEVISSDPKVQFWLPSGDSANDKWESSVSTIKTVKPTPPPGSNQTTGTGPNSSPLNNIGFIRNLDTNTYSLVVRVTDRKNFGNYSSKPRSSDIRVTPLAPSVQTLGGHHNVPPPIPPGSSNNGND